MAIIKTEGYGMMEEIKCGCGVEFDVLNRYRTAPDVREGSILDEVLRFRNQATAEWASLQASYHQLRGHDQIFVRSKISIFDI